MIHNLLIFLVQQNSANELNPKIVDCLSKSMDVYLGYSWGFKSNLLEKEIHKETRIVVKMIKLYVKHAERHCGHGVDVILENNEYFEKKWHGVTFCGPG